MNDLLLQALAGLGGIAVGAVITWFLVKRILRDHL